MKTKPSPLTSHDNGDRVPLQKTQTSKEKVQYLGYVLTPGAQTLAQNRKISHTEYFNTSSKKAIENLLKCGRLSLHLDSSQTPL